MVWRWWKTKQKQRRREAEPSVASQHTVFTGEFSTRRREEMIDFAPICSIFTLNWKKAAKSNNTHTLRLRFWEEPLNLSSLFLAACTDALALIVSLNDRNSTAQRPARSKTAGASFSASGRKWKPTTAALLHRCEWLQSRLSGTETPEWPAELVMGHKPLGLMQNVSA